jgi:catechol 2,3-dioxygenase-like lactoylglutathione lyase family enzyme
MLTSLDHLVIAVRDLDAATATYGALFGRRPSWRGDHGAWGTANSLFRLPNTYVELLAPVADAPVAAVLRDRLERAGEGPYALAFGTDDIAAAAAALDAAGMQGIGPLAAQGRDHLSGAERRWRNLLLQPADTRAVPMFVIQHDSPADALPPAAPIAADDSVVSGVDHAVVMTPEPDAAIALYRDRLGLRLALDRTFEGRGMRLLFFRVGGITVEIAAPVAGDPPAAPGGDSDRFWGISYRVPNAAAARARLAAAGFDVSEVRAGFKPGTQVCTVRGETHGVATLLIEPSDGVARDRAVTRDS